MVKDGVLKTTPLGRILASITRHSVLEIAETMGLSLSEELISTDEFLSADEWFTAYTGTKILPIKRLEDHYHDAPGPVTSQIRETMDSIFRFEDNRFAHWFQSI